MVVVMKKVQTIIQCCMVSIGGTLGCTPSQHDIQQTFPVQPLRRRPREHVLDRGARGVKRGARRHPVPPALQRHEHVNLGPTVVKRGEGSGSGQPYGDPFDSPNLYMPSFSLGLTPASQPHPSGSGTSQMPSAPSLGFASFQSPHSTSYRFLGFGHHLLRVQPIHQRRISLYRRHPRLTKRSGRMTWTVFSISALDIVLMVSDEPSILYSTVNNDDDEVDGSDGDDAVSSQSESDEDNDPEEGEFPPPLNPENPVNLVIENIVR
ncbi:hypothetical protein M9H77_06559 [Catharanthus roseus]|uniref:Uncharacterized protein n=1 Tax=Catharanthus roseus TaxID=4058 RepID=A0ACC0BSM7_CATRO|nr:hypothetical protein M9H77_06559 [Catharanthus roseus]